MRVIGPQFYDTNIQRFFDKYGFAKVKLLSAEKVDKLLESYQNFAQKHSAIDMPFVTTSHSNDAELIAAVDELILSVAAPEIAKHLFGYEILFSNFLLKKPIEDSGSAPHQDVTLVDEDKFMSFSVWISLGDIEQKNGCMNLLPASHRMPAIIRPNPFYPWRYRNVIDKINTDMVSCPTEKGEALIFSHATIHGSFSNLSGKERLAAVVALYPEGAETYHYELPDYNSNVVHKYKMDKEAFVAYIKGAPPTKGKMIAELPYDSTPASSLRYWIESRMAQLSSTADFMV